MAAESAKNKGNAAVKVGDWQLALANYNTAMDIDPSVYTYPLNASLMHLKLLQYAEAEKCATKALHLMPGNAKALFRRGLARKGRGKLDAAREDLASALQAGAGDEVKKELDHLEQLIKPRPESDGGSRKAPTLATTETSGPAHSSIPPATASKSPSTSRLRAAVSSRQSSSSKTDSTGESDLMRPISTRRLEKAPEHKNSAPNQFAHKREAREARLVSQPTARARAVELFPQTSTMSSAAQKPGEPDASDSPPIRGTSSNSSRVEVQGPVQRGSNPESAVDPPTTAAALEQALTLPSASQETKLGILRSLKPEKLVPLLGSSLTPDLLSSMITVLSLDRADGAQEEAWKIALLKAVTRAQRASSVIGFMDDGERQTVREIIVRARRELDSLEAIWQL